MNTALAEWRRRELPRRAAINSLGLGGTNAHVILEEAPPVEPSSASRPGQLLVLSARTESALDAASRELAESLKLAPQLNLADVAYTLQTGRKSFSHRRIAVCQDNEEGIRLLESPAPTDTAVFETAEPPVFFMFPGGGAQHANMGAELYQGEPVFREHVDQCLELFSPHLGFDLKRLLYRSRSRLGYPAGVSDELTQTSTGLPALFAVEYALAKLWMSWGIRPKAMIGHSLGEYVAACLSGVISLQDAVALVALRSRLFQELPEGRMLSVASTAADLEPLLGDDLWLATINAPSVCVVSGPISSISSLERLLNDRDIETSPIHISVAAHSEMVAPILERFAGLASRVRLSPPGIPYISNVTGNWVTANDMIDSQYWTRHLRETVRFSDGVRHLLEHGAVLLEVGPGNTLTSLARQHDSTATTLAVPSLSHPRSPEPDTTSLLKAVGRLWLAGARIDWHAFHSGERRRRVPLPSYPFERRRYWLDRGETFQSAAHGKRSDVSSWFYIQSWKRTMPLPRAATESRNWLLIADELGLADAIR
ncbi:MAG: acyltransferase domain-containing protein, partial [Blastocatellia bacterium]